MKPIERILAAVDFSEASDEALKAAYFLAQKVKGKLNTVHVVPQTPFEGHFFGPVSIDLVNQIEKKASEELAARVRSVSVLGGPEVTEMVLAGVPSFDLLRYAKQQKTQCIVAGHRGKEGVDRLLLGSVADSLIRKAECPVWTLRGEFSPPQKILVLTDLSENSRAGFRLGFYLARIFSAKAHLLHVFEFPYVPSYAMIDATEYELKMKEMVREEFQKWVEEAALTKADFASELLEGRVRGRIDEVIKRDHFDLVVVSTHGQSALFHKHLGSIPTYLAHHAPCSLITVRPEGFRLKEI